MFLLKCLISLHEVVSKNMRQVFVKLYNLGRETIIVLVILFNTQTFMTSHISNIIW